MMTASDTLRALNRRLYTELARVLQGLSDERLRASVPAIDERPLVEVTVHVYHRLLGFASAGAGQPWPAAPATPTTTADALALLHTLRARVDALIAGLPEGTLERGLTLPWGEQTTAFDAIAAGLVHGFVHAGQIVSMRAAAGFPLPPEHV